MIIFNRLIKGLVTLSLLIFTSFLPVSAQDNEGASSLGIEEIIVTARKREESLQDVPIAITCLLYTSPSPRDRTRSRMPSSA